MAREAQKEKMWSSAVSLVKDAMPGQHRYLTVADHPCPPIGKEKWFWICHSLHFCCRFNKCRELHLTISWGLNTLEFWRALCVYLSVSIPVWMFSALTDTRASSQGKFGWNNQYLSILSCWPKFNLILTQHASSGVEGANWATTVVFSLMAVHNMRKDRTVDWAAVTGTCLEAFSERKHPQLISVRKITGLVDTLHTHFLGWQCNKRILGKEDWQNSSSPLLWNEMWYYSMLTG